MSVNERFIWGVEVLKIDPSDFIFEIGCGAGLFAEQIGKKLTSGKIVAIDKSASMIKMAIKRNRELLTKEVSIFLASDLMTVEFKDIKFDKILAFNVNFFWKNPSKELELIKHYLKSSGFLYVFYQTPNGITEEFVHQLTSPLETSGFKILDTTINKTIPSPVVCVVAKPS